ncbi:MAG: T9SS type A sorting domain-containing protein [Flavobacteriaceae bacterium]|nr:T9SS type A sorting domain-containing protein [Flavobacteriaceae bacterium]
MNKNLLIALFSFFTYSEINAQIVNDPPFILSVDELKNWTSGGATADANNIATENLATRFSDASTQLNSSLANDIEIAWLPDGMNNFGNYNGEQPVFNYYNFTHWAYIDKLVWFGGTADDTVQIPSAPWVNAAHKNGVKVFGNVFFAPNAWGGSTATMTSFLEKDASNNFIAVTKLKEIIEYYNFDGWFINEETDTNATNGQLMYEFVRDLTAAIEPLGKEVIWYDAMLLSGSVSWQNYLNANNNAFLQNDENNNGADGYEQRVSSAMFTNFFWNTYQWPEASNGNANAIGRSPYDVFSGVDLWPGRNQPAFETGGNDWMSDIHNSATSVAYTSLGLFAANAIYNNAQYSNFNNDPNDRLSFYEAERHMFGGADFNPSQVDASGFKGISNWVPASSTITTLPFETSFNTGHGRKKFVTGTETSSSDWHNMSDQEILPTWQFAVEGNQSIGASFDFNDAYNGGNSVKLDGMITGGFSSTIKLYKTNLIIGTETVLELMYKTGQIAPTNMDVLLAFDDNPTNLIPFSLGNSISVEWNEHVFNLSSYSGKKLVMIAFELSSVITVNPYAINIGKLKVFNEPALSTNDLVFEEFAVFPNPSNGSFNVKLKSNSGNNISIIVYDIKGRVIFSKVYTDTINFTQRVNLKSVQSGIYLVNVTDGHSKVVRKIIIN